ncbi:phosphatase PAP2 family protein [Mangrovibacterium diazotrophicum]|uniref:Undecaprenyl-diphosphatase n=1 Tax=Mangrovibacterium diazotrophicum TaxID=1261403 RepID=A0A419VVQ2_9BACT|nr:phosphatase PAP2 family protein [Mangrovibacterium diazotrophicum]RKD86198.1 undecaprenyl-diphosphatase [Mangrovibacterium diazotrophicum]
MEHIIDVDKSIFFYLNGMHSPFWDVVMALFTRTEYWILLFGVIIYYIIRRYRMKSIMILILIALCILIADQFSGLIKDSVQRLRPTHDPTMQDLVHNVLSKGGLYGYFSAHAANTFAVATFTSFIFKNRAFNFLIFSWAIVVSYSRIYLGVHFPFDVLTGVTFGTALGYGAYRLLIFLDNRFFVLGLPKLAEARLRNKDFRYILIIVLSFVFTTLLLVNRLQHFNWIQL